MRCAVLTERPRCRRSVWHANGLGAGISVTMAVTGGAFNLAVTVGLWAMRRLNSERAVLYVIAEGVGAVGAALLLHQLIPGSVVSAGTPVPAVGPLTGAAVGPAGAFGPERIAEA